METKRWKSVKAPTKVLSLYCSYAFNATRDKRLVGGAIGGRAHYNGWIGVNGMVPNTSNTWKQHFIPAITMSPSSYNSSHQPPLHYTYSIIQSCFFLTPLKSD